MKEKLKIVLGITIWIIIISALWLILLHSGNQYSLMTYDGIDCGDNCVVSHGLYLSNTKILVILAIFSGIVIVAYRSGKEDK